jgi:hypothetical protein
MPFARLRLPTGTDLGRAIYPGCAPARERGVFPVLAAAGAFFGAFRFGAAFGFGLLPAATPGLAAARFAALRCGTRAALTVAGLAAGLAAAPRRRGLLSRRSPSSGIACSSENVSGSAPRGNEAMTPSWLT